MGRSFRKKLRIGLILISVAIPLTVAGIFYWGTPEPPIAELDRARIAVARANKSIFPDFVPQALIEARILYDSAMIFWKAENERFILKRDYTRIRTLAIRAEQLALVSPGLAAQNTRDFINSIERDFETLKKDTSSIEILYDRLPVSATINKKYTKAVMLLKEAELNLDQKQYKECRKKLDVAKSNLADVVLYTHGLLDGYFTHVSKWKGWAEQTIRKSAENRDYALVIDKFASKCYVYKDGILKTTFEAELGKNWIGHKRYAGDKATPEGMYKITKKKDGGQTRYYRALLLNYPNDDDRKSFHEEIRNRTLPRSAKIGGMIEIHGGGGKGVNWTEGCVALADDQMDALFRMVPVGCPVTIVGSLQPYNEVIKKPKP